MCVVCQAGMTPELSKKDRMAAILIDKYFSVLLNLRDRVRHV